MKNLKSILAAVAVVAASAGVAQAAPTTTGTLGGVRVFAFTPANINAGTHEDTSFQNGDQIGIQQTSTFDVEPYFYVRGSLGGAWQINGWDANESQKETSSLEIFHNDTFTSNFSGFGNPTDGSGHSLNLAIAEDYETAIGASGASLPKGPAANINSLSPNTTTQAQTGGYTKWNFDQYVTVPTNVPAGNYSITPVITFTSNAS